MPLPTFLIIGAPRSGTTSLHHYLQQHPEVFMSAVKEPNYFAFTEPREVIGPGAAWVRATSVFGRQAYEALFAPATTERAIGEASPRYLSSPQAAERIRQTIPEARLVAILRHPVERAYASYLGHRRDGFDPAPTFEAALRASERGDRESWLSMDYPKTGHFHRDLTHYYRLFPAEQIRVYLFDDLELDPGALLRDLFGFLGVNPTFEPDTSRRLGGTGNIRNPLLRVVMRNSLRLRAALGPFVPRHLRERAYARMIRDLEKPPLKPETRSHLQRLYRDDILHLQDLIGRDLRHWLQ
jgi:hypothetical protein